MRAALPLLLLILLGCEEPKPATKPKAAKKPADDSARKIIETMQAQTMQAQTMQEKEPPPAPDTKWIGEARRELLAALEAKGERLRANAGRIGGLTRVERAQGSRAAKLVKEKGYSKVPPSTKDMARRFAPDYIRAMEQDEAIRLGELPGYPDQKSRKEFCDRLATAFGPLDPNSPTLLTLTEKELGAAVLASEKATGDGLGALDREERRLLLAVGALDWFGKQLDLEQTKKP